MTEVAAKPSRRGPSAAAAFEARVEARAAMFLARRGWRPTPLVFDSYGRAATPSSPGWVRVLTRVLVMPPTQRRSALGRSRGWRRYISVSAPDLPVRISIEGTIHRARTEPGGYLDLCIPVDLAPGTYDIEVSVPGGAAPGRGRIDVIDPAIGRGVVSDVDDTVLVTLLPSPLRAFWNTFVMQEGSRSPVPGMATFLTRESAGFTVYLSTGAWNYGPVIRAFLQRNGFPPGTLIMTDWGPSAQRWFRSGVEHKRSQLRRLHQEFPELTWLLVGDNGEHDPVIYEDFAAHHPGVVDTIAIRTLSPVEHLVTGGVPLAPDELSDLFAPHGATLQEQLAEIQASLQGHPHSPLRRDVTAPPPAEVRRLFGGDGNALVVATL